MDREFTYTKERLRFLLERILADDIAGDPAYLSEERAEEGFEKRAALEFLLWFLEEAFPPGFRFRCRFEDLEQDYPPETARAIAEGKGFAARHVDREDAADNVILVDFRRDR